MNQIPREPGWAGGEGAPTYLHPLPQCLSLVTGCFAGQTAVPLPDALCLQKGCFSVEVKSPRHPVHSILDKRPFHSPCGTVFKTISGGNLRFACPCLRDKAVAPVLQIFSCRSWWSWVDKFNLLFLLIGLLALFVTSLCILSVQYFSKY